MANTCVFVCAVSKSTENYVRIISSVKEIVKNDVEPDSDDFRFAAEEIHIDFELANYQALQRVFPDQQVRFCFFHCLQSWYRRLSTTGFKRKLKPCPANAKFREFWDFISTRHILVPSCVSDCDSAHDLPSRDPDCDSAQKLPSRN